MDHGCKHYDASIYPAALLVLAYDLEMRIDDKGYSSFDVELLVLGQC